MRKLDAISILALICIPLLWTWQTHVVASDETQIRRQIDAFAKAFRAKDIDGVMSLYAPAIVTFDLVPPLQYHACRKPWQKTFASYEGAMDYEIHNLCITTGEDVAFSHSLNRMGGTMKNGQKTEVWVRWTACFREINGSWLITHEHVSVPADLESGLALLDLEP
jgi:ketosteroid isomerase-like protein